MFTASLVKHNGAGLRVAEKAFAPSGQPAPASSHVKALNVLAMALLREVEELGKAQSAPESNINLAEEVRRFEESLIRSALIRTGGRQRRAAKILGVKVTTLNAKIKRFGINWEQLAGVSTDEAADTVTLLRRVC